MCGGVGYGLTASATAGSTGTPPPGATAVCRDGTFSYSLHHSGTCSHHGGVARWLDGSTSSSSAVSSLPLALGTSLTLARRTASSGCKRSPLPDRRCSPGAYYSRLTRAV